ncbi:MAG: peptidylprolyl isomerase [Sphingorhabdus sp.]
MKKLALYALCAAAIAFPALAQAPKEQEKKEIFPSPNEIVGKADAKDWVALAPSDLLVMDLAPDAQGKPRRVVIQLMPPPFSQGWIGNMRKLAKAHWWDGTAIVRVQDNYVTQWGDPDGEDEAKAKKLPKGLKVMAEDDYTSFGLIAQQPHWTGRRKVTPAKKPIADNYAGGGRFWRGWPFAFSTPSEQNPIQIMEGGEIIDGELKGDWKTRAPKPDEYLRYWPVHCYGMVGVGRGYSPDTGTGAELYTVIGHAPRHLDRNIALVGRIIEGIEHLSSLPRGTGPLGFYEKAEQRVPILSIRLQSEMPTDKPLPTYEYLSTESAAFAKYADARANRRDPFFIKPAGGADICNIPVPVRRKK